MSEENTWEKIKRLPPLGVIGIIALFTLVGVTEVWLLWNWIGVPAGVALPITWGEAGWVTLFTGCTGALGRLLTQALLR
jgi:hypothetical protein